MDDGYILVGGEEREEIEGGGGGGGGESEGEESENLEGKDEVTELSNVWACRFSELDVKQGLGPRVALEHSYQFESEERSTDFEQRFNELFDLRSDVNVLLLGFIMRLGLPEETMLTVCFRNLRHLVGRGHTLELNEEAMKIIIDPEADEDAVEAVDKFNRMLGKCQEFQDKVRTSKRVMKENLKALERESKQTTATLDAIERAKKQFALVQEWVTHARCIIQDTKTSSKALATQPVTGFIRACV